MKKEGNGDRALVVRELVLPAEELVPPRSRGGLTARKFPGGLPAKTAASVTCA
jgi:hypothetical protein